MALSTVESPLGVKEALNILFGEDFSYHEGTLHYLQPSGIKKAFRSKAMLCHPDMLGQQGEEFVAQQQFQQLQDAYNFLMDLKSGNVKERIVTRNKAQRATNPKARRKTEANQRYKSTSKSDRDFFYCGKRLPETQLRLGEYLYYSGHISWKTLINAIVSQRKNSNVLFGQYFIGKGLLNHQTLMNHLRGLRQHNQYYHG